jgi:putative transposase
VTEKFEFIDAEYAAYQKSGDEYVPSVVKMCIWMEVSRSGFYEWRNAPESATAKRRGILALYVKKSFEDSDDTYGYRRVHADLAAWGVPAGPELVRSLMRELGLEPCQPRPWRISLTEGDGQEHDIPDLVARDFTAGAPGQKMAGSGSRREFHPPAPTEPCVIVSHYTALATLITRNCGPIASERTFAGIAA